MAAEGPPVAVGAVTAAEAADRPLAPVTSVHHPAGVAWIQAVAMPK